MGVQLVLLLLEDTSAQVYRSALKFTKVVVFVVDPNVWPKYLPNILKLFASPHMTTAKMLVRRIVDKIIKTLSFNTLKDAFPRQHLPLLVYLHKAIERRQRKKFLTQG